MSRPADAAERGLLGETFAALCARPSPTGSERACADHVIATLGGLGLSVTEDDVGPRIGGDTGNLLCRVPAADTDRSPGTEAMRHGREDLDDPDIGANTGPRSAVGATATTGASAGAGVRAGTTTSGDAGPGDAVLFCAHLDTVPCGADIRPELRDGVWIDALGGVLGADDKASVAALLVLAARLVREPAPVAVELLFTVGEEAQLRGATAFDAGVLEARSGYIVDHPSPIGGIVLRAPGHVRFEARYRGRASHAGIAPERGRSAILAAARALVRLPHGRLADGSTVNVGFVEGGAGEPGVTVPDGGTAPTRAAGTGLPAGPRPGGEPTTRAAGTGLPAGRRPGGEPTTRAAAPGLPAGPRPGDEPTTNVVPAHARLVGEVRGPDPAVLQTTVDTVEAALHDAAHDPAGPVDLDLVLEQRFAPYRHGSSAPVVTRAARALQSLGIAPRPFADAGGSDANVLNARGIPTLTLAGGNEAAHEPGERISEAALEGTLDLLLALVGGGSGPSI